MHGRFASPLHSFVEMGGDSLVSGLLVICFAKSFGDLSPEALLDLPRLQVQKLNLLVDLGEFSTDYLDPGFQLSFDSYQFSGH